MRQVRKDENEDEKEKKEEEKEGKEKEGQGQIWEAFQGFRVWEEAGVVRV